MAQPAFGARMREERLRLGLRQAALADDGLSTSYVSLLEAGRRDPTRKIAELVAGKLGVDVEYLLGGQDRALRQERELDLRFAELALGNGDPGEARTALERLRASGSDGDATAWSVEHNLARAYERCGDLEAAISLLERLRLRAEQDRARWPWMPVVIDLSRCYREAGDISHALDVAGRAVDEARQLGLQAAPEFPRLVVTLSAACRERGDLARASELLRSLLSELDSQATRRDRGSALWNAAVIEADRGHFAEGILMAERALAQFAEEDDVRADGLLRTNLAWMLLDMPGGDAARALSLLQDAHTRLLAAGLHIEAAYTETELARASLQLADTQAAIGWAQSALERLGDGDRLESARARLALAAALLASSSSSAALEEMTAAAQALEEQSVGRQAASVWRDMAELHAAVGDLASADRAYAKALELLGMPRRVPRAGSEMRTSDKASRSR